ncbi:MAG: DNA-directed RNA polymerase subunit alpha, partial [Candidatus Omnitrophica bacterium]|nr:DNA-directed RNA polymerase subunit alpha [Candidatus Omnitrophota bacterium]
MKEFIYPSNFIWEKETLKENYGKLIIEPLERGYGVTIGNALRRVLLSSIPGVAITGLRIKGVLHEFSTLEGMKEDIVEVVLNIKQIALKPIISEYPHTVTVEISDKDEICAGDLINDNSVEV